MMGDQLQRRREQQVQEAPVQQQEDLQQQQQWQPVQLQRDMSEEEAQRQWMNQPRVLYNQFMRRLAPLPTDAGPVPQQQAPQARASKKQRKREYKQAQAEYKAMGTQDRLLTVDEVRNMRMFQGENLAKWAASVPKHSKISMQDTMALIRMDNYSNFENLDNVMRNLVANKALQDLNARFQIGPDSDPQAVYRAILAGDRQLIYNPALRLGLSLAQKTDAIPDELKNLYRALDEAMSTTILTDTLTKQADPLEVQRDLRTQHRDWTEAKVQEEAQKGIEANKAQQIQIAKRLLLMQLSTFQRMDTVGDTERFSPWDRTMAVALSHCSRVVLTMPRLSVRGRSNAHQHQRMWEAIYYQQDANGRPVNLAQDNARGSSTHSLRQRKVARGLGGSKEKKVWFNFSGQRGMNCAIGGLGNRGVSRQVIRNDGSCGHFYSMYKEADDEHFGAMLMGLESDAYGVTNQQGHTHDIHATGEKASSLGGQRSDEIGDKYSGRQCDLSHMNAADIADWMLRLENAMKRWQAEPEGMAGQEASEVMALLTGHKLDRAAINQLWNRLGDQ